MNRQFDKLVKFKSMLEYGAAKKTLSNVYHKIGLNTRPQSLLLKTAHVNNLKTRLEKSGFGKALKQNVQEFKEWKMKNGTKFRH
jgi:hypothetical protein